jgi:hypothetical protein
MIFSTKVFSAFGPQKSAKSLAKTCGFDGVKNWEVFFKKK